MRRLISVPIFRAVSTCITFLLVLLALGASGLAQATTTSSDARPVPLITQAIDEGHLVELKGNVYPMATPNADQGAAEGNLALQRMMLVFKRSEAQELALKKFLDEQKNPKSANYHKWLTPDQFGARFGVATQDVATVSAWLRSHGFSIDLVARGKNVLVFSGTNAQLLSAFHTEMHKYQLAGMMQYANVSDPKIPAALAPVVAGIAKLNSFPVQPLHSIFGVVQKDKGTGRWKPVSSSTSIRPQLNTNVGTDFFAVGPSDFAAIYNVRPLWDDGIDGTGQTIAIVGRSDISRTDVDAFRSYFGLPAANLNVIYNGPNPGRLYGDEGEAELDVQWSGAVAKNATIDYVVSGSTVTTDGIQLSAHYVIDNNLAPVMSVSYGMCELGLGTAGNQLISEMWQQAAAQGITVIVASGDAGSAACDQGRSWAEYGTAVNGLASTPYNIAIGGTDLYGTYLDSGTYWNPVNDPTTKQSAYSYMPELPWNDSCGNPQLLEALQALGVSDATTEDLCNDWSVSGVVNTVGAGSGPSTCTTSTDGDPTTCSGGHAKPAWQSGVPGIPDDSVRDLPDVSLFAGSGLWGSFYVFCSSVLTPDHTCNFDAGNDVAALAAGGTSFGTPAFAGIMALVNQKTNSIQGNANYELYKLAADQFTGDDSWTCDSSYVEGQSCKFYDISLGSNAVPCITGSIGCTLSDPSHFLGVLPGWNADIGYDLAVGLGTVNAYNLVNAWTTATATFAGTSTTLTLDASSVTYGAPITGTITVASGDDGNGVPTGDTSLVTAPGNTGVGFGPFALNNGTAAISGNGVAAGTYSVAAYYAGDATFAPSSSDPSTLTITKAVTSSTLSASRTDVKSGDSVTFDVTIGTESTALSPSGTVTYTNGTTGVVLGSVAVVAASDGDGHSIARASFNIPARLLNQGNNSVTATYSGDGNYVESAAAAVTVTYTPPFSLSLAQASITVQSGASADATITLTANDGQLPATVVFECVQPLPEGVSCAFSPATAAAGSSTTTSTLTVHAVFPPNHASSNHASLVRKSRTGMLAAVFGTFALLPLIVLPRKRRQRHVLSCFGLLMLAMIAMASCGSDSAKPVTTTTAITATPASGPQGSTFSFIATVTGTGATSPTGTVTFLDNNNSLGTAAVANGTATFSTSSLALGAHSVIASYGGDAHSLASASATPAVIDVQYQTSINVNAHDSLGNSTTLSVPVTVQ